MRSALRCVAPRAVLAAGCAALVAVAAIGCGSGHRHGPPEAVRTALAQSTQPLGAFGRTLGLSRVVIPVGAKLARQTGKIQAGEWIVEQPSDHHSAANRGDGKIVVYLATLLRTGAPPSTPG